MADHYGKEVFFSLEIRDKFRQKEIQTEEINEKDLR